MGGVLVAFERRSYFIHLEGDRVLAFAGLWESWERGDQTAIESCTLLTTGANDLMRPIHDQMPVILRRQDYDRWLDPAIQKPDDLTPLLVPYPGDYMVATPVSTYVNSPSRDDPRCVEPAG